MKFFVLLLLVGGCALRPRPKPRASIKVYVLEPIEGVLRASEEDGSQDLNVITTCNPEQGKICTVFVGESYLSLRKYLVDLEGDLRACQQAQ